MTFDWGYGAPFSVGWWWVDADGRLFRFAEWYGWNGRPNQGLRLTDSRIAAGILERETGLGIAGRRITRLAGPDCFAKKPDYRGGGQGPATAEVFARAGLPLAPGDPSRIAKIRQFHERLRPRADGPPMTASSSLFARARLRIPGGVNSPVRACRAVGCDPLFIDRAAGSTMAEAFVLQEPILER